MRTGGEKGEKKSTLKKRWTWEGECTVRNCLTWFNREIFLLMCEARVVDYLFFAVKASKSARALLVSPAQKSNQVTSFLTWVS